MKSVPVTSYWNGMYVDTKWKSEGFACFCRGTQNAWEWQRGYHFQYDGSRMKDRVRFCASSFLILRCWRPQAGRIAPTTPQAQENEIWRRLQIRLQRHSSHINSFVLETPWDIWNQISQRMSEGKHFHVKAQEKSWLSWVYFGCYTECYNMLHQ